MQRINRNWRHYKQEQRKQRTLVSKKKLHNHRQKSKVLRRQIQLSRREQMIRRQIQLSQRKQMIRRQIQLSQRNQLLRNQNQLSQHNQLSPRQIQFSIRNKQTGRSFQQNKQQIGRQNQPFGRPYKLIHPKQQVTPTQSLKAPLPFSQPKQRFMPAPSVMKNQFLGNPVKNTFTTQRLINKRLVNHQQQTKVRRNRTVQPKKTATPRKSFYTPQDLLNLAPIKDKAMWKIIISRLPADYRLPDPGFVHIYRKYFNSK
jgi:hypothetical protein